MTLAIAGLKISPERFNENNRLIMSRKESDLVVIDTVQGELTAQVLKTKLESAGIPVLLKYESAGIVYGLTIDGLGEVKILVPREFAEEAKEIIQLQA